jgi:hypothetical protein
MGFAGAVAKPITADAIRKVIAAISAGGDQFIGDGFARTVSAR